MTQTMRPPEPLIPARLPLLRPKRGRWLAGVCQGISLHLGVSVAWVRLTFVITALIFGMGILAYIFLWIFVPAGNPFAAAQAAQWSTPAGQAPLSHGNRPVAPEQQDAGQAANSGETADETGAEGAPETILEALRHAPKPALLALAGVALIVLCALLNRSQHTQLILSALFAGAGLMMAWSHFDSKEGQLPTMLGGIALIFIAFVIYVANPATTQQWQRPVSILAGLLLVIGVGLAILPWANAMLRSLTSERASKEREEERADMAAHLHDGVLQTLALIQLHSGEPDTVLTLARSQERELREWLYQTRSTSDRSVSAGLKDIAAHIADEHGKAIEVVSVGDAQPSEATDALLDATGQTLVNAVTHGGEPIAVYCEAGKTQVDVFVRDHGEGFEMDNVPADRLGIRESIIGRIKRRGGTVDIVSRPGWGTEVCMHMPIESAAPVSPADSQTDDSPDSPGTTSACDPTKPIESAKEQQQ